jgi:hypothetical protein
MGRSRLGVTMLVLMEASRASVAGASMPVNGPSYPGGYGWPNVPPNGARNPNPPLNAPSTNGFANAPASARPLPSLASPRPLPMPAPRPPNPSPPNYTYSIYSPPHPVAPAPLGSPKTPDAATIAKFAVGASLVIVCGVAVHKLAWPKIPPIKPPTPSFKPELPKPPKPPAGPLPSTPPIEPKIEPQHEPKITPMSVTPKPLLPVTIPPAKPLVPPSFPRSTSFQPPALPKLAAKQRPLPSRLSSWLESSPQPVIQPKLPLVTQTKTKPKPPRAPIQPITPKAAPASPDTLPTTLPSHRSPEEIRKWLAIAQTTSRIISPPRAPKLIPATLRSPKRTPMSAPRLPIFKTTIAKPVPVVPQTTPDASKTIPSLIAPVPVNPYARIPRPTLQPAPAEKPKPGQTLALSSRQSREEIRKLLADLRTEQNKTTNTLPPRPIRGTPPPQLHSRLRNPLVPTRTRPISKSPLVTEAKEDSPLPRLRKPMPVIAQTKKAPPIPTPRRLAPLVTETKQAPPETHKPTKTKKVSFVPVPSASRPTSPRQNPFTLARPVTPPLPNALPVRTLFGPRIAGTNFCQHAPLNNCYMLAAMDGILRHPRAEALLAQIPIQRDGADYLVHFPSQRAPIRVTPADLAGRGARLAHAAHPGLSIIEQGYLKLPGATPGRFDGFSEAMTRMFGIRADVVQLQHNGRNAWRPGEAQRLQVVGPVDFTPAERRQVFEGILTQLRTETNPDSANIYAAMLREGATSHIGDHHLVGAHYYAIRIPESSATEVVLGDPLDTRRTFRLSMTDFLENFDIEGVRLPLR